MIVFIHVLEPCRFKYGDVKGKQEKFIGRTRNEEGCSIKVQEKIPSATGARWIKNINYCYAEFGNFIKPTRKHARGSRACLFEGKSIKHHEN